MRKVTIPRVLLLLFDQSNNQIWSIHYDNAEADSEWRLYEKQGYILAARLNVRLTKTQDMAMADKE